MTTVATDGPLSKMISTYMKGAEDTRGVVKNLASTFLNTETTVMEYDLKTASKLQGGVLLNMLFMWYLHFKLNKVQPILMQIVRGFIQLAFNPLFQDYVSYMTCVKYREDPPSNSSKRSAWEGISRDPSQSQFLLPPLKRPCNPNRFSILLT